MKNRPTLFATAFAFCLQLGQVHGAEQLPDGWRIAAGNWRLADGALVAGMQPRFVAKLARHARQARRLAFRVLVKSDRTSVTGHAAAAVVVVVVARLVLTLRFCLFYNYN